MTTLIKLPEYKFTNVLQNDVHCYSNYYLRQMNHQQNKTNSNDYGIRLGQKRNKVDTSVNARSDEL